MTDGNKPIVAVDDGYAQIKMAERGDDGQITKKLFRSSIRPGRHALGGIGGEGRIGAYETEETDEFTVSEMIEGQDLTFNGFHTSPQNRTLVIHALVQAGYSGREVDLVTGLPVGNFYNLDSSLNKDKINAKRANLKKGVRSLSHPDVPLPLLGNVSVGCQAVAAWINHMVDDTGAYRYTPSGNLLSLGRYAIVDVGGRTTDIALVINEGGGSPTIDMGKSGTRNLGVLDVYKAFMDLARERFKFSGDGGFTLAAQDQIIRTKRMHFFKEEDVSDLVAKATRSVFTQVAHFTEKSLQDVMGSLRGIIFVGGGCALFRDIAKEFPNGDMPEDPEFSNAVGLLKYREVLRKAAADKAA